MKKVRLYYVLTIFVFAFLITFSITTRKSAQSANYQNIQQTLINQNCIKQALFSSRNDIRQTLCDVINNEKKSIKAAIYILTDKKITQALIDAKAKKIDIEIVTCATNLENAYNKIWELNEKGVIIYFFDAPKKIPKNLKNNYSPLMHNKFFIFENNLHDKSILWTGSFNCTTSAQKNNRENVVILDDNFLIEQYKIEFEDLKTNSKKIENYLHKKPVFEKKVKETNQETPFAGAKNFWNLF